MKRLTPCALLALLLPSCGALLGNSPDGLRGLKVERAAAVLRLVASEVEKWDTNKDGLITADEAAPLGLGIAHRLYAEMRKP